MPPDIDSIEELPDEPRGGRRYGYPPKSPRDGPRDGPRAPMTLANYEPDFRPKDYDRTPEGKSFREQNLFEPDPRPTRQPGDGGPGSPYMDIMDPLGVAPITQPQNGARPKAYEPKFAKNPQKNKLSQYKPEQDLPKRYGGGGREQPTTTQSYRVEADKYEPPPREARSYRYQPDDMEIGGSTSV